MAEFNTEGKGEDEKGTWFEKDPNAAAASAPPGGDNESANTTTPAAPSNTTAETPAEPTSTLPSGILPVQVPEASNTSASVPASTPPPATTFPADASTTAAPGAPETETSTTPPDETTSAETASPSGDDEYEEGGDDTYGGDEYEGDGEWGGEPEETKVPYVSKPESEDPFDKPLDESKWAGEDWPQESPKEMMHDKNVIIAVACTVAFGFVLAICTAQQVIENPDGCCARYAAQILSFNGCSCYRRKG